MIKEDLSYLFPPFLIGEFLFLKNYLDKVNLLFVSLCRDVYKRVCVAGGDPTIVESPTEPKWSDEGKFIIDIKLHILESWPKSRFAYFILQSHWHLFHFRGIILCH